MQAFTEFQLRRHDGEQEYSMYIAHKGIIYEVTDCPKWRSGLHEGQHFPGQNLTDEILQAPHGDEVFNHPCAKVVGKLIEK